jgi:hopene-associated glycosyltransferase HpnB
LLPVPAGPLLLAATSAGGLSALAWLGVLLDPARAWDLSPVGEDGPAPPEPATWPPVAVVVPARNESGVLPETLPALLGQDYPGEWKVVVVDDRSADGTAAAARGVSAGDPRLAVVDGAGLPAGWVGKVWALEQGVRATGRARYLLLTDADIRHAPGSLRRLVAESEAGGLGLNSRMARLRCASGPERLLIPPFVFFFNLLYPMRRVNDPASRVAAAAGGCELVRRDALERAGGLRAISGEIIDDVNLARRIKALGEPVRLAVSRGDVESLRPYGSVRSVWRMVRRTAFDELRYSWLLLAGTLVALGLLLALPPLLVVAGLALGAAGEPSQALAVGLPGLAAWTLTTLAFSRTVRYFGLRRAWAWTLPAGGVLYGGMTLDSALRHLARRDRVW